MSASPELTGARPEFVLRPIATTVRSAEDRGDKPSPSKDEEEEECRTPTSKESKLPSTPKSCPPAPRKPRRVPWCKRIRPQDLEVITVGAEELERLFRRRDERYVMGSGSHHAKKRRCRWPDDK
ncbi:cyclin-dependent protein kinase inhibitor SMR1 [Cocos nucifera]|uniref:Cyclin-dependent protein kinase inhibitor SMR1 n=1 Tax=Cocos nucifera TaxID=13894 RepID=A0A8K0N7M9_COCNU|nr:cyclin-dependent protein kinase inhibitor SMR1 [Cocos nucifera]